MTLEVEPLDESNGPGWRVDLGRLQYVLWAPRPARNHGRTFGGLPVVTRGRDDWAVGWDALDDGGDSDYWKGATLDEVLAPLPGEVSDAFAAAADEWRRQLADDTSTNVLESALEADDTRIDLSEPSRPRRVHQQHLDADADHVVVSESASGDGVADNCGACGLAVTSDGKRHGFDA